MRTMAVLAMAFWACGDRVTANLDLTDPLAQHAYFPLETGRWVEYQVDSVVYDFAPGGGTLRDSSTTFVRELVGDTLTDNTGALAYQIERYESPTPDGPWVFRVVETAALNTNQAIRTEQNLRFLKLVFPMDRRSEWDGNLWIDADREIEIAGERMRPFVNWLYEVDTIDKPDIIGPFSFDSVLTITEVDQNNAIELRISRAKYARGIGLVWREQWILDSQYCNEEPTPADCLTRPWIDKAERGYVLKQVIIDHN